MSKQEKVTEQNTEKTMTKYDLKVQRRKEQKEREKREKRISTIISVAILAALVCLVASFPIRNYLAVHETYVEVNGQKISRVEYDYNYNLSLNNYISTYGSYLSYFGVDFNSDLSTQMYSDTLTWKDFFDEMTVESIVNEKALKAQADAAGFTYDTDEDFEQFKEDAKAAASEAGASTADYIRQSFGEYATIGRLEPFLRESILVNAFYDQISDEKAATDEEAQAYYEENKSTYDSVDYYLTMVEAELPTEPTELADPVEETEEAAEGEEEAAYEPSEAEIEKAMADAKEIADTAVETVRANGELRENASYSGTSYLIRDWLFDESRQQGDSTVIEDTSSNQYYVIGFDKRYLVTDPTASAYVIVVSPGEEGEVALSGQNILDGWKNGEATEDSFAALADSYASGAVANVQGGYYEAITKASTPETVQDWLYDASRAKGDNTVITTDDGYTYVLYYVGSNDPEWMLSAKSTLLSEAMEAYLEEIREGFDVQDPKGNLRYLQVQEQEETVDETAVDEATVEESTTEESTAE